MAPSLRLLKSVTSLTHWCTCRDPNLTYLVSYMKLNVVKIGPHRHFGFIVISALPSPKKKGKLKDKPRTQKWVQFLSFEMYSHFLTERPWYF